MAGEGSDGVRYSICILAVFTRRFVKICELIQNSAYIYTLQSLFLVKYSNQYIINIKYMYTKSIIQQTVESLRAKENFKMAIENLMEKYKYAFETIEFAVYCSPRDDSNYRVFKKNLEE